MFYKLCSKSPKKLFAESSPKMNNNGARPRGHGEEKIFLQTSQDVDPYFVLKDQFSGKKVAIFVDIQKFMKNEAFFVFVACSESL
jgi:hypothetical protein